jgi:hypothetical protein
VSVDKILEAEEYKLRQLSEQTAAGRMLLTSISASKEPSAVGYAVRCCAAALLKGT